MSDINKMFLPEESNLRDVMLCIDKNERGIAIIIDSGKHLVGTITDGDIRRAILSGKDLDDHVSVILKNKNNTPYPKPITAKQGTSNDDLLLLMREASIRWVPILDDEECVVDLITIEDLVPKTAVDMEAVIMAGGQGSRLRPLTENLPKPMLPVGGRPLMELIIDQLKNSGINKVNITTHYKPEKIVDYFGNGNKFGVDIDYVQENQPLGTAGALGLMKRPDKPLLVMNGDILTNVNYKSLLDFHQEHNADLTMAVRNHIIDVPYGVIECDDEKVLQIKEKPQVKLFVNAGIYLLEPTVFDFIPSGKFFNMTDLIQWLIKANKNVISFPINEYWLDIGQHNDYNQAQNDISEGRI